jgi:hypothetical protein
VRWRISPARAAHVDPHACPVRPTGAHGRARARVQERRQRWRSKSRRDLAIMAVLRDAGSNVVGCGGKLEEGPRLRSSDGVWWSCASTSVACKGLHDARVEAVEYFRHGRGVCFGARLQLCAPLASVVLSEEGRSLRQELRVHVVLSPEGISAGYGF